MARPTRIDVEGGWYHVLNRGIERREIFKDETSYEHFLELLSKMPERFGVKVHGYVLMNNHYHLQIETPRANLSKAVQWLNVSYSVWYNRRYRRVGPLFQGRFKAILHEQATCGVTINRYIHLNPVRLRKQGGHEGRSGVMEEVSREMVSERVRALKEYPWSSYRFYSGRVKSPDWITTAAVLAYFNGGSDRTQGNAYGRELEEAAGLGRLETDWKSEVKAMLLLGPEAFVDRMKGLLKGDRREQTSVRQAATEVFSWVEITGAVATAWNTPWEMARSAHGSGARAAALYVSRHYSDQSLRELGQLAGGMEYPAVTMAIRRFEKRLQVDKKLGKRLQHVLRILRVKP
jgi:REP-associated tyrosine transposase